MTVYNLARVADAVAGGNIGKARTGPIRAKLINIPAAARSPGQHGAAV